MISQAGQSKQALQPVQGDDRITASPSPARAWYAVVILMTAYLISVIDRYILTLLVVPIRRDLSISDTQFGMLTGLAFAIFYSVAAIPIASLADRKSRRKIIAVAIIFWSAMTALCGTAQSYGQLFLYRIGVGAGEAALSPAAISLISDIFPRDKLGRALTVFTLGGAMGMGLAYIAGGAIVSAVSQNASVLLPVVGETRSWQLIFFVVALPGLLLAGLTMTIAEPARPVAVNPSTATGGSVLEHFRAHARSLALYISAHAALSTASYAFLAWLPTFMIRKYGADAGLAGLTLGTIFLVVGPAGMLTGGLLLDRWTRHEKMDSAVRVALLAAVGLAPVSCVMPFAPSWSVMIIGAAIVLYFASLGTGVSTVGIQIITPPPLRARSTAVVLLIANAFGLTAGPVIVPLLTEHLFGDPASIDMALSIVGACAGTLSALLFLIARPSYITSVEHERKASEAYL